MHGHLGYSEHVKDVEIPSKSRGERNEVKVMTSLRTQGDVPEILGIFGKNVYIGTYELLRNS